jgi:hypothetical protein
MENSCVMGRDRAGRAVEEAIHRDAFGQTRGQILTLAEGNFNDFKGSPQMVAGVFNNPNTPIIL